MEVFAFNCFVCGNELVHNSKIATLDIGNFKVCSSCLNSCDPTDNYKQARQIIDNYINISQDKSYKKAFKHLNKKNKK